jgi:hypothetical protein
MSSVPPRHQIIHERRFPTTQIDNRRRAFWRSSLDEPEGGVKMCTVPTRRVRRLGAVNRLNTRPRQCFRTVALPPLC